MFRAIAWLSEVEMKYLNIEEMEYLAIGAAILGTGGGGDPYLGKLMAIQAIKEKGPVPLLDVSELKEASVNFSGFSLKLGIRIRF